MAFPAGSRPYRVLVVEDDHERAQELRTLFAEDGYECEVTLDLDTAGEVVSERKMEAVLVDLEVDGVSAEEALAVFTPTENDQGLIFFNGSTDDTVQRRCRRQGADSYLSSRSGLQRVVNATCRAVGNAE